MHINDIDCAENFEYSSETLDGNVDFVITVSDGSFVADYFNKNISNSEDAYIETLYFESDILEEAIKDAEKYILD